MTKRSALLLLLGILIVGLCLRLYWYIGPFTTDCFQNAQFGYQIAAGEFDINKEYYAANRIGFLFPIGLAVWLLQGQAFAYSLWGLLCSLGCIALAYILGTRIYDRRTGLVAAALLAVLPMEIYYWSPLLIDGVTPLYWGSSIGLFYLGLANDTSDRHRRLLLFASGAVLGLAFYTREHAPVVFLVMLAYLIIGRAWRREVLWVLVGFASSVVIGEAYYYAVSGQPLLRLRRLWEHFGPSNQPVGGLRIGLFQGLRPFFFQATVLSTDYFGCLYWFAWIAAAVLVFRRTRADRFPLVWFLGLYVAMDIMLRNVVLLLAYPPYANVLNLPAALLVARVLAPGLRASAGTDNPRARWWLPALGPALLMAGAWGIASRRTLAAWLDTWASGWGSWGRAHPHDTRIATVPIILGSLLLATGIYLFWRSRRRLGTAPTPGWGAAALVFLVVSSLFITDQGVRWRRDEAAPIRSMARIIEEDAQPVYLTSLWSGTALNFFLKYRTNFRRYWDRWESEAVPGAGGITVREVPAEAGLLTEGSYVLIDKRPVRRLRAGQPAVYDVVRLPSYVLTPPPQWRLLFDSEDYALYRTARIQ